MLWWNSVKKFIPSKNRPILYYLYGGFQGCATGDFSILPLEDVFILLKEYEDNKPGSLAHELSHSLGLDDVNNYNKNFGLNLNEAEYLMGTGYCNYPNTELTQANKDILKCYNSRIIVTPASAPDL